MSIQDKRAEAKARLKAVQNKVNRLRRDKGVEISGTEHDVRIESARLNRYNSRQLDAFIQRANAFVSRKTQFVAGAGGTPLPAQRYRVLQKLETHYTNAGKSIMDSIGELEAPFTGMTIRQRDKQMLPDVKAGGEAVQRTFEMVFTDHRRIKNKEALEKFINLRIKQADPTYASSRVKKAREQLDQMFTTIGAESFKDIANKLSDEQFFVFFEYGPYVNDVGIQYSLVKQAQDEDRELTTSDAQMFEDTNAELRKALKWASKLPTDFELAKAEGKARSQRRRK